MPLPRWTCITRFIEMMDSPLNIGDTTTNSINHRLQSTHIHPSVSASIFSSSYSGTKVIQLNLEFRPTKDDDGDDKSTAGDHLFVLRRVHDSYINASQLLQILVKLGLLSDVQVDTFFENEIVSNPRFNPPNGVDDFRRHSNLQLQGLWVPYDRAVSLAVKFDVYEFCKKLFLVDVHDYERLPKSSPNGKRPLHDFSVDGHDAGLMGSPTKRHKRAGAADTKQHELKENIEHELLNGDAIDRYNGTIANPNFPYTLPPQNPQENHSLNSEIKLKFSEVFKKDDTSSLTYADIKALFAPLTQVNQAPSHQLYLLTDLPLDSQGKTALHFAATLASSNLVSAFIKLGLCSPIRGTATGESPLISTITVTNSMEKNNFKQLLSHWLYPALWLLDGNNWLVLHHLSLQPLSKLESTRYYFFKLLEWIVTRKDNSLYKLVYTVIDIQDVANGNTALHLAADSEAKWMINFLLELNANVNISNKSGLKPIDYDIVKEVTKEREADAFKFETEQENYLLELIRSNVDILKRNVSLGLAGGRDLDGDDAEPKVGAGPATEVATSSGGSNGSKILLSIQNLLHNTNKEYETILTSKKNHSMKLNEELHQASMVTANNRFVAKKIAEKLIYLDNVKLQLNNITDRIEVSKREIPQDLIKEVTGGDEVDDDDNLATHYDADEPFKIPYIYDKLKNGANNDLDIDETKVGELPPLAVLQARLKAYEELNSNLEDELTSLLDYSALTSKFKKVVSFCTGVDINEVDDLLDGLLEAVEGQQ